MKPTCVLVRSLAPSADQSVLSRRVAIHLGECLSCQAEMARYAKLRRQLASLAAVAVPAPPPLVGAVERAINDVPADAGSSASHAARLATAAGAVVAAAAGAVAVAVWRQSKAPV